MSGVLAKWRSFALAVSVTIITGCGTENGCTGSGLSGFLDPANPLQPHPDALTSDEAYRLLRRATFGAKPEDVTRAVERGLTATVDELLTDQPLPAAAETLAASFEDDIPKRWLVHMLESPSPLRDRLALFWHDRFATSRRVLSGNDRSLAIDHWAMLRQHALGNYRDFLAALTIDPMMLIWLDGANSPKDKPNENYAREFWELFTLGRDILYTEADIQESARAFTGTTLLRESGQPARPIFDILNHDESLKSIFPERAAPANFDFQGIIDLTLAQPEAARYVAKNLFTLFIHDHPSDVQVQVLADQFVEGNFEIAPLVRRLLMSNEIFRDEAMGNQVASPVEHVVGVFRTLDVHLESEDSQGFQLTRLVRDLEAAGQDLLNPPGVEGWGEDLAWMEDQWVLNRVKALGRTMEFGPNRTADLPYHLLPPTSRWDQREIRREIVSAVADVFHLPLTDEERDIYVEVLDQNGHRAFHLEQPDRQTQHVQEMIRLMAMDERVIGR